jgi:3-deoxy-7-phosphoheptulonate synthase
MPQLHLGRLSDLHVLRFEPLATPASVLAEVRITDAAAATVEAGRQELRNAMAGQDDRLVVIAGPCSIHEADSAVEYARRLTALRDTCADRLIVVMRAYFEKPRTTVGWKGLIYDPARDESYDVNRGLREARRILLEINSMGLPCATEFLDPIVPQYTADLVAWAAIGARTTESQTHRQLASGLSMPVGFKNSTDGSLQPALDAMTAALRPQAFLGIDPQGQTSIVHTSGNPDVHLVLRGGASGPNFSSTAVAEARSLLEKVSAQPRALMVDCSHDNSGKDFRRQPEVCSALAARVRNGEPGVLGLMLESHLVEGRQPIGPDLTYGQSITDGCIGWDQTEDLLRRI